MSKASSKKAPKAPKAREFSYHTRSGPQTVSTTLTDDEITMHLRAVAAAAPEGKPGAFIRQQCAAWGRYLFQGKEPKSGIGWPVRFANQRAERDALGLPETIKLPELFAQIQTGGPVVLVGGGACHDGFTQHEDAPRQVPAWAEDFPNGEVLRVHRKRTGELCFRRSTNFYDREGYYGDSKGEEWTPTLQTPASVIAWVNSLNKE